MTGQAGMASGVVPTHPADLLWLSPTHEVEAGQEATQGVGHAFRVGGRWFLIPMGLPAEVAPMAPAARLPFTAHWCPGLANVRGSLVPVYDLARFFGEETSARLLLVLGQRDAHAALPIDEITLVTLPLEKPSAPFTSLPNLPDDFVCLVLELDGKDYLQLDLSSLLLALAQSATLL